MRSHAETVQGQFDPQARAYLTSPVHARGADLEEAGLLIATLPADSIAIDVGTGAGHLAFLLARKLAAVVAADPSPSMLEVVREAAVAQSLMPRLTTSQSSVEALPFPEGCFDLVATRYSAHHWLDLPRALREMRRAVKDGGHALVIDLLGDDAPLVDTHLQAMELLRDPGHVRNRSQAEWQRLLAEAGFAVEQARTFPLRLEFASWVERMRVPPETVDAIRRLQRGAPTAVARALEFESDGSFRVRTGLFWARAVSSAVADRGSAP
ncbi:MAG: class I SAM-dependent methyltransferase [Steroidobacteraceae bacterium]